MTQETAELLHMHYLTCHGFEFFYGPSSTPKQYVCRKCGQIIAEEPTPLAEPTETKQAA